VATALYPLRNVQFGGETTAGTAVAATARRVGEWTYTEDIPREFEEFPRGVRAPVTGGGYDISGGSMLVGNGNLTWEEILYPLNGGILLDAAGVDQGTGGPYLYTFDPVLTDPADIKTYTAEFVVEDGSTLHVQRESAYAFCTGFTVTLAANQIATITENWTARRSQTSTVTASQTVITGRTPVPSNLFKLFIDDTWANLGTTQKTQFIRAATLTVDTGLTPDFTLDGRADLDLTGINSGTLNATLDITVEANAAMATELGHYRGTGGHGTVRFYRLSANNGGATTAEREIVFDMAMKHLSPPSYSQDNGIEIVTMRLGLEYDATGAKAFVATVQNGLSAQP
jgi:hypothetical protein